MGEGQADISFVSLTSRKKKKKVVGLPVWNIECFLFNCKLILFTNRSPVSIFPTVLYKTPETKG